MPSNLSPHTNGNEAGRKETHPDEVLQGHTYDGIREYDNPMPGWWVWSFVTTVVVSGLYAIGLHAFGFINSYEEDLAASQAKIELTRAAYARANPTFDASPEALATVVADAASAEPGAAVFKANCAACHGDQGQGVIGPNLADKYWLHGGSNVEVFDVISKGVLDKGMPAWESVLSPEERAQVVAYIHSVQGTNPPNAKEPQGEAVE